MKKNEEKKTFFFPGRVACRVYFLKSIYPSNLAHVRDTFQNLNMNKLFFAIASLQIFSIAAGYDGPVNSLVKRTIDASTSIVRITYEITVQGLENGESYPFILKTDLVNRHLAHIYASQNKKKLNISEPRK